MQHAEKMERAVPHLIRPLLEFSQVAPGFQINSPLEAVEIYRSPVAMTTESMDK
jgi:hypothetical protein